MESLKSRKPLTSYPNNTSVTFRRMILNKEKTTREDLLDVMKLLPYTTSLQESPTVEPAFVSHVTVRNRNAATWRTDDPLPTVIPTPLLRRSSGPVSLMNNPSQHHTSRYSEQDLNE
uniref:Uncharacterized protein n=1 Tax=Cacopsylla melanoneura TaxID=428564 RepID=A0A8D8M4W3_9HEMI